MFNTIKEAFKQAFKNWLALVLALLFAISTPLLIFKQGDYSIAFAEQEQSVESDNEKIYNQLSGGEDDEYYTPSIDDLRGNSTDRNLSGDRIDIEEFEFGIDKDGTSALPSDEKGNDEDSGKKSGEEEYTPRVVVPEDGYYDAEENSHPIIMNDDGLRLQLSVSGDYYTVVNYAASAKRVTIPERHTDGLPITAIGDSAFSGKETVETILLHSGITHIGEGVFDNCTKLKFNVDDNGGQYLGTADNPFYYFHSVSDKNITSYTVNKDTVLIGAYSLFNFDELREVIFPKTALKMGYNAIGGCDKIESVTLPFVGETGDGVTNAHLGWAFGARTIGGNISYMPRTLKTLVILGGAKIRQNAFYGADMIENLTVPYLGNYLNDNTNGFLSYFWGGESYNDNIVPISVKRVEILSGVTKINDYAFYKLAKIEEVIIPNSVTSIGNYAFSDCSSLTNVAFNRYEFIRSLYWDAEDYKAYGFNGTDVRIEIVSPTEGNNLGLQQLHIVSQPDANTLEDSYRDLRSMGGFYLKSDKRIDSYKDAVFYYHIYAKIPEGYSIDSFHNMIGDNYEKYWLTSNKGTGKWQWYIGVTRCGSTGEFQEKAIGYIALKYNDVNNPNGHNTASNVEWDVGYCDIVTTNDYDFYYGNTNRLTEGDVTWEEAKIRAEELGGHLATITSAEENKAIGKLLYSYLGYNTSNVWLGASDSADEGNWQWITGEKIGYENYENWRDGEPNDDAGIEDYLSWYYNGKVADKNWNDLPNIPKQGYIVEYESKLTSIGNYAFYGCSSLTDITIPDSVTSIGYEAFYGCSSLTSITIPDSVTSIGSSAFSSCRSLTSITIGGSVTSIGNYAFRGCSSLTSINVDENNAYYKSIDGNLYSKDGTVLIQYAIDKTATEFAIPDSVTRIESYAFSSCSSLTSITIPDSVTSIKGWAFSGCSSLYYVINKSNLQLSFGSSANGYVACYAKAIEDKDGNVTYKNNPIFIENDFMFEYASGEYRLIEYMGNKETVTLPLTYNGNPYTVYFMKGVKNVIIPYGFTSIGNLAFCDCSSLTSIIIPNSVTSIGQQAFDDCYKLTSVTFGANSKLTSIGSSAFSGCRSLTSVTIPDSVTSIGDYAFSDCSNLTSINVSENNTNFKSIDGNLYSKDGTVLIQYAIGKTATEFTIPDGVTSIGLGAFSDCSNLTSINVSVYNTYYSSQDGILYDKEKTTIIQVPQGITGKISLPNSVVYIKDRAFAYCSSLTGITIGNSVTSIGDDVFYNCSSLTSINVSGNNAYYSSQDGILYNKNKTEIIQVPQGIKGEITLPNTLITIGYETFRGCSGLTSITIPDSVTSIGIQAFYNCSSLKSVTIGNSVTSIEYYAFCNCSSLTEVAIPDSVTSIEYGAFYYCSSLKSVTIGNSVTSIGEDAFYYCSSLTEVNIPDSVTSIGDYAFYRCSSLTSITIPNGVTSIGDSAFDDCSSLTSITIPDSVTSIGSNAFYYCQSLYYVINKSDLELNFGSTDNGYVAYDAKAIEDKDGNVTYKNGNIFIENDFMFEYVSNAYRLIAYIGNEETVTLPLTYNGNSYTIYYMRGVKNVIIPQGFTSIGDSAFYWCSSLTSINLPDSLTSIGQNAFLYCRSLTSITIPDNVTSIGNSAFSHCSSLTSIIIPDSVTSIGNDAFSGCTNLTSVNLPNGINYIGSSAFANCTNLTTIIYDGEYNEWRCIDKASDWDGGIEGYTVCFNDNSGLLYESDDEITEFYVSGYNGVSGISAVPAVYAGRNVTEVYDNAFLANETLISITLPETIVKIGKSAFKNCVNLTYVYIPDSISEMRFAIFDGCVSLAEINLPFLGKTVNDKTGGYLGYSFGAYTYEENGAYIPENLKTVTVRQGESVINGAFYNCEYILAVDIQGGVTAIGDYAFYNAKSLRTIQLPEALTSIGKFAFANINALTELVIPDKVTYVGKNALYGSNSLRSITIGNGLGYAATVIYDESGNATVTSGIEDIVYGNPLFGLDKNNSQLERYIVADDHPAFMVGENGILYVKLSVIVDNAAKNIEVAVVDVPATLNLSVYSLPDFIVEIYPYAFAYNRSITSIDLEYVRQIGNNAFFECTGLITVNFYDPAIQPPEELVTYIGNKSYSQRIGDRAFMGCINLLKTDLQSDGIISIGDGAFMDCTALRTVILGTGVREIGLNAFGTSAAGGGALERIVVHKDNPYYADIDGVLFAINEDGSLTLVLYPACHIGYVDHIAEKYVTETVYKIKYTKVLWLKIPYLATETVTRIEQVIYQTLEYVTDYAIPTVDADNKPVDVAAIESYAFRNAKHLDSLTVDPSAEMKIGDYAFSDSYLQSVYIGENVTSIGLLRGEGEYTVFSGADYLINIDVAENNAYYSSFDGVLFDKDITKLIKYPSQKTGNEYYIPKTVDTIASMAFKDNHNIGVVSVNSNLLAVGLEAFYGCSDLQVIYFNHVYAPKSVMENAFTVKLSVNNDKHQAILGYNEAYYENGDGDNQYGWKNYDGVYNIKAYDVVPTYDPDYRESLYYAVVVVDTLGYKIDGVWISLSDFNGITETVATQDGVATFWSYKGAEENNEFALDFEEIYTLSVLDERSEYFPYLSENIFLDGKTCVTYITLTKKPEVYGVSCNGKEINSESVILNKSQFDFDISSEGLSLGGNFNLGSLGFNFDKDGIGVYHESVTITVVAYVDQILVNSLTENSCVLLQNGNLIPNVEVSALQKTDDGMALYSFEVPVFYLAAGVPICAKFEIEGQENQAVETYLNIDVINFNFTVNDIDFKFGDLQLDLGSAGEVIMKLLNGRSWNFNIGDNVKFGIDIEDDEVQVDLSAKYKTSNTSSNSTELSAASGFERYKQAHSKGSYFYQFKLPVVELRDNENKIPIPIVHMLTFNIRFYECPDAPNYFYYRCRIYEGVYENRLCDKFGRVNGLDSFLGTAINGRDRVGMKASMIMISYLTSLVDYDSSAENLLERFKFKTVTKTDADFKTALAKGKVIDEKYVSKEKPAVENNHNFSVGLEGKIILKYDKVNYFTISAGYVKGTISYSFTHNSQFVVWFIPITLEVKVGIDGTLQLNLTVDESKRLSVEDLKLTVSAYVSADLGVGCSLVSAGVYGKIGTIFILEFYPYFGVEQWNIDGEIGVYAKFLWWRKDATIWSGSYDIINRGSKRSAVTKSMSRGLASMYLASEYESATPNDVSENAKLFIAGGEIYKIYYENVYGRENYDENNFIKLCISKWTGEEWTEGVLIDDNGLNDASYMLYEDQGDMYLIYAQRSVKNDSADLSDIYADMGNLTIKTARISGTIVSDVQEIYSETNKYKYLEQITVRNGTLTAVWAENADNNMFGVSPDNYIDANGVSQISETTANSIWLSTYENGVWTKSICIKDGLSALTNLIINNAGDMYYIVDTDGDLVTTEDRVLYVKRASSLEHVAINDIAEGSVTNVFTYGDKVVYRFNAVETDNEESIMNTGLYSIKNSVGEQLVLDDAMTAEMSDNFKPVINSDGEIIAYVYYQNVTWNEGEDKEKRDCTGSALYGIFYDGEWNSPVIIVGAKENAYISAFDVELIGNETALFVALSYVNDGTSVWEETKTISLDEDVVLTDYEISYTDQMLILTLQNSGAKSAEVYASVDDRIILLTEQLKSGASETFKVLIGANKTPDVSIYTAKTSENAETIEGLDFNYSDLDPSAKQIIIGGKNMLLVAVKNNGNIAASGTVYLKAGNDIAKIDGYFYSKDIPLINAGGIYYFEKSLEEFEGHSLALRIIADADTEKGEAAYNNIQYFSVNFATSATGDDVDIVPYIASDYIEVSLMPKEDLTAEYIANGFALDSITVDGNILSGDNYSVSDNEIIINKEYIATLKAGNYNVAARFVDDENAVTCGLTLKVLDKYTLTWTYFDGEKDIFIETFVEEGDMPVAPVVTESYETDYYIYTFSGWDADGNGVADNIGAAKSDSVYLAIYREESKQFTVNWQVGEKTFSEKYSYEQTPIFKGNTSLDGYDFIGWDREIVSVDDDAEYIATYKQQKVVIKGDINGDGIVNTRDVGLLKQHVVGTITLSSDQIEAANVYEDYDDLGNAIINTRDVAKLQQYIVGIIDNI